MNIDILNAYCGNVLVSFPRLAQGRLNIHQVFACIELSALCRGFKVCFVECLNRDSWDLFPGSFSSATRYGVGYNLMSRRRQYNLRPESKRDYPPNLSILISGGKENNSDFLSNGE